LYPFYGKLLTAWVLPLIHPWGQKVADIINETMAWLYGALVLFVSLCWGRRSAADFGLGGISPATIGIGIGAAIATLLLSNVSASAAYGLLHRASHADAQAAALAHGLFVYAVVLAIRAGTVEELLYRGIAIEQFTTLTGMRWIGAVLAALLFILSHAFVFDWIQLVPIGVATLVLTLLYLWRHDLWMNILAHVLVDAFGLLVLTMRSAG